MQQLHLVGFTTDLEGLIFSARRGAKSGSFVVPLDDKLVATIAEAHRRRNGDAADGGLLAEIAERVSGSDRPMRPPKPESKLSPREIQARLRTGRTIEEVAREAKVDTDWVEKWAAPVMAEQQKVVTRARGLVFSKARKGGTSVEPLGRAVAWNVADKGVWMSPGQFDRAWSAYQSLDSWILRFRYRSRGRDHVAEWEIDGDELLALDRNASQLAYLDRARRRKAPPRAEFVEAEDETPPPIPVTAEPEPEPEPEPQPARRTRKARKRPAAKKRTATARPAASGTKKRGVGRPPTKARTAKKITKKAASKKATTRKATAAKAAKKPAAKKRAATKKGATTKKATRAKKAAKGRRPTAAAGVGRESRARLAASDMLAAERDLSAPRFGTSGNPAPARRSGAGGKRTVVRARGRKKSAASPRTREAEPLADAPITIEPADEAPAAAGDEVADASEEQWSRVTPAPAASATPPPRRLGRRQPRLRATVRRRDRDVPAAASALDDEGDARADAADDDEGPAVVPLPRAGKADRAMIAADRAGDLVGDEAASDRYDPRETIDAETALHTTLPEAPESEPEPRPRRRLLRR